MNRIEMNKGIKLIICCILSLAGYTSHATEEIPTAPLSEGSTISLLTSGPSDMAIFTAWGHSAIRVKDPETGIDQIFNYGIFSFGKPLSFVARFVSGQTDYRLGRSSMMRSMEETVEKNADYYEQVLNLTQAEKEKLYGALLENYKPENRVYRYKYFTDNCATRPRKLINKCIDGELIYGPFDQINQKNYNESLKKCFKNTDGTDKTYRDLIAELLHTSPWYKFGIDMCLGYPTDQVINNWDQLFLPIYLKEEISYQSIKSKDGNRPLVKETNLLLEKKPVQESKNFTENLTPLVIMCTLFLFTLLHALYYNATGKDDRWAYLTFFGIVGLWGTLIFYVSCLSVHEFVWPNWNLLWLSPLQLLIAILVYIKKARKIENLLMLISAIGYVAAIVYYIASITIGKTPGAMQHYNPAFLPLILMELTLTISWLKRHTKKAEKH